MAAGAHERCRACPCPTSRGRRAPHANGPLSVEGRRRLVRKRCQTRPVAHVTAETGISRACAGRDARMGPRADRVLAPRAQVVREADHRRTEAASSTPPRKRRQRRALIRLFLLRSLRPTAGQPVALARAPAAGGSASDFASIGMPQKAHVFDGRGSPSLSINRSQRETRSSHPSSTPITPHRRTRATELPPHPHPKARRVLNLRSDSWPSVQHPASLRIAESSLRQVIRHRTLELALPEYLDADSDADFADSEAVEMPGTVGRARSAPHTAIQRSACRRLLHTAGSVMTVTCWTTHDRNVCLPACPDARKTYFAWLRESADPFDPLNSARRILSDRTRATAPAR